MLKESEAKEGGNGGRRDTVVWKTRMIDWEGEGDGETRIVYEEDAGSVMSPDASEATDRAKEEGGRGGGRGEQSGGG